MSSIVGGPPNSIIIVCAHPYVRQFTYQSVEHVRSGDLPPKQIFRPRDKMSACANMDTALGYAAGLRTPNAFRARSFVSVGSRSPLIDHPICARQ